MTSCKFRLCMLTCHTLVRSVRPNLYKIPIYSFSTSVRNNGRYKTKQSASNRSERKNSFNPGMNRQLKIIRQDTPDINCAPITEEDIEELESDFLNAREMQEYHTREVEKLKFRDELKMTERKHFKPVVEPNMLTWSDKEQIKKLHKEDPQFWNIDKLSESFPATHQIIKKIIKSNWRPESNERIRKHDEIVAANWKAFNEDRLVINCSVLKEHLKKFTKRTALTSNSGYSNTFVALPKPKGSEFIGIIQSYKTHSNTGSNEKNCNSGNKQNYALVPRNVNEDGESSSDEQRNHPAFINGKSTYTLEKFREKIKEKQSRSDMKFLNEQDKLLLKGALSESVAVSKQILTTETVPIKRDISIPNTERDDSIEHVHRNEKETDISSIESKKNSNIKPVLYNDVRYSGLSAANISKRIHIPKSKVKVGYLYKVNDCFYSHDGFFLYRIPGMVEENT